MDQKFKVVLGALCAILCGLCLSETVSAQTLPEGKGKAEFVHNCTACHRADLVTRVPKTPAEWKTNVAEMAARGTDGSQEDLDNVVLYLSTYFATGKSGSTAASAVLNPSEIERGKHVIAANGCLACHRVENQGAYTAPSLNGVGGRRTTAEIRAAIVSPHPTRDQGNNLVQLTTTDGKTIIGRILSQDDHDVRLIDTSGKIATYLKPELRQITMIDAKPMPSYEEKITGEDLDGLLRYLATLTSLDEGVQK